MVKNMKKKLSIRFAVLAIFVLAHLIIAGIALGLQFYFSKQMATDSAFNYYDAAASQTADYLQESDRQAMLSVASLAKTPNIINGDKIGEFTQQLFIQVLQNSPSFYSASIGFDNGNAYQLINIGLSHEVRHQLNAAPSDRWLAIHVEWIDEVRISRVHYLDENFNLRVAHTQNSDYDVVTRPWFANATRGEVYKTDPYMFKGLQAPGLTYSTIIPDTNAVIAIDIALSSLSTHLEQQRLSNESEIYLYQKTGEIIASNQTDHLRVNLSKTKRLALSPAQQGYVRNRGRIRVSNSSDWPPITFSMAGQPQGYTVDILELIEAETGLMFEHINGHGWAQLLKMYQNGKLDMLPAVYANEENKKLGYLSSQIIELPFSVVTLPEQPDINEITQLFGKSVAITHGWSLGRIIREKYPQIKLIEVPFIQDVFDAVKTGKAYAGIDSKLVLQHTAQQFFVDKIRFHPSLTFGTDDVESSVHFVTKDQQLLEIIDLALAKIDPKIIQQLKVKWNIDHPHKAPINTHNIVPYQQLIAMGKQPQYFNRLTEITVAGESYFIYLKPLMNNRDIFSVLVPVEQVLGDSLAEIKWSMLITGLCLLVVVMLSWFFVSPVVSPVRELSRQNEKIKQRKFKEIVHTPSHIIELDQLSQSMIEMAGSIEKHEQEQRNLLDSFIKIISQAIDDKSHYTGGHCERVPELAMELASAASESSKAQFSSFKFENDDEIREFNIAAWLHDCGKITTPVHIVDKGTKLEVIFNRIHEIRMRFEVLWRDAEIDYLNQLAESPQDKSRLLQQLKLTRQQLREDYAFIADANVGGEFMDEAHIQRLNQLATITWQRYFDDRLGLSPVEEARRDMSDKPFPVTESLLADKPEHIIPREKPVEFPPQFNIKMSVPDDQSNQGEVYNLSIGRGTLTKEDRYIINEHIIGTIKMLEALPLPPELSRVARYASTHHETLKGTGYPRKLSADDLSIPERVLVIADIFEALTAADRPYKKAKPVSVAIDILHKMALDQHIDIDLFELLLTTGLYREYALKFMPKSQIDEVDIQKYIRSNVAELTN